MQMLGILERYPIGDAAFQPGALVARHHAQPGRHLPSILEALGIARPLQQLAHHSGQSVLAVFQNLRQPFGNVTDALWRITIPNSASKPRIWLACAVRALKSPWRARALSLHQRSRFVMH
jgi:hypothetical protein